MWTLCRGQQQRDPQRLGCDQEGCDARRHRPLRPVQRTVTDEEEQERQNQTGSPFGRADMDPLTTHPDGDHIKCDARDEVPYARCQQWRDRLHRVSNGEVGRTPDHIDREESQELTALDAGHAANLSSRIYRLDYRSTAITCQTDYTGYTVTMAPARFELIGGHPALDFVNTVDWRGDPARRRDVLVTF